jgi:hypothetical protein
MLQYSCLRPVELSSSHLSYSPSMLARLYNFRSRAIGHSHCMMRLLFLLFVEEMSKMLLPARQGRRVDLLSCMGNLRFTAEGVAQVVTEEPC